MNDIPIIQAEHITKHFGAVIAVDDVSLSVPHGICFGLLGPNGAGKTTFIEILEGILQPGSGNVRYLGKPRKKSFNEHIGIMFQNTALLSYLTVYETLSTFRALYRQPAELTQVIDLCHLTEIRDRFNDKISGGQRQRLLLALALINQPDLLFLDEPSTGLDPQARRNLWEIINTVKGQGRTIILTTHYMEEAHQICDQVAIMDQGRIIVEGTPEQLVTQFSHGLVLQFPTASIRHAVQSIPYEIKQIGEHTRLKVPDMNQAIRTLLELEVDLTHMIVELPDLESVFLNLTGRRLRD